MEREKHWPWTRPAKKLMHGAGPRQVTAKSAESSSSVATGEVLQDARSTPSSPEYYWQLCYTPLHASQQVAEVALTNRLGPDLIPLRIAGLMFSAADFSIVNSPEVGVLGVERF